MLSEIHSILDWFVNEKDRIKSKGPQALIGVGLTLFFFICAPSLVYPLYCLLPTYNVVLLIVVGSTILANVNRTIFNLVMNHIYSSKYPYFEQYRIMNKPWPWEVDEEGYKKQYLSIIKNTIRSSFLIFPLISYSLIYFNLVEYVSDPELYPSSLDIFKDIMFMTFVFETSFYWSHRLFHTPWLYKKYHKKHHEYQVTVSIASIYNHPLDYMITNALPGLLSRILLGKMHVITVYLWSFYSAVFIHFSHCGYAMPWFPWGVFPLGSSIEYHDYHHSTNIGNYGSFSMFWDTICGTNKHYWKSIAKQEEKSN